MKKARGPTYIAHLEQANRALEVELSGNRCSTESSSRSNKTKIHGQSSSDSTDDYTPQNDEDSFNPFSTVPDTTASCSAGYVAATEGYMDTIESIPCGAAYVNKTTSCRYGWSSGIEVLRRMQVHLGAAIGIAACDQGSPAALLINALDRPSLIQASFANSGLGLFLPSSEDLMHSTSSAFSRSFCLRSFVDRASTDSSIRQLHDTSPFWQPSASCDDVALVYAIAALGELFDQDYGLCTKDMSDRARMKGYVTSTTGIVDTCLICKTGLDIFELLETSSTR